MVKKSKEQPQKAVAVKEETKVVETPAVEESVTVQMKAENEKKLKKQIKQMTAQVNQHYDLKQAVSAVKALQKFSIAQKKTNKGLLDDEDDYIQLSFTLSQVPSRPTPRPAMIKVDHPFTTGKNNARLCVFVKDPQRAFKDQI